MKYTFTVLEHDPDLSDRVGPFHGEDPFDPLIFADSVDFSVIISAASRYWYFEGGETVDWPLTFVIFDYPENKELCRVVTGLEYKPSFYAAELEGNDVS